MGRLWRVRVSGPLEPYAVGFRGELESRGYSPWTVIAALALMEHLSRWLVAQGLGPGGLTVAEVERFVHDRRGSGAARRPSPEGLTPLVGYLRGLGVVPEPVVTGDPLEQLLGEFAGFLTNERGLALGTVCYYRTTAKRFLLTCFSQREIDSVDFDCVTAGEVRSFIVGEAGRRSIGSVKNVVTALRALLRFLHVRGYVAISLADAVPAVAGWRTGLFPHVLSAAEVAGLLECCDRRTVGGRRDYAILVLLARLGLRAGEVAALSVDNIDWRAGEILVCGKGNRYERLPLPADVGGAIADYCRWDRRRAGCRSVFLHSRAPYAALSSSAIGKIVERACDRAGLPRMGAHRLRHAAATALRQAGAPLWEIRHILRHAHPVTTAGYGAIEARELVAVARRWPGGAR
jgi:integrase/recombinase XerD